MATHHQLQRHDITPVGAFCRLESQHELTTHCRAPGWASLQAELLRREGVHVDEDGMGEFYIDFGTYGWFPDELPGDNEAGA